MGDQIQPPARTTDRRDHRAARVSPDGLLLRTAVDPRLARLPLRVPMEHSVVMTGKRWNELNPRARRLIIAGASVEGALKIAALIDLARRPATQVRGSKTGWAVAIIVINSVGAAPITYFTRGIRR